MCVYVCVFVLECVSVCVVVSEIVSVTSECVFLFSQIHTHTQTIQVIYVGVYEGCVCEMCVCMNDVCVCMNDVCVCVCV